MLDIATVRAETEERRREIGEALERFAHNTIEHMREERELLAGKIEMPRFATDFRDRPALVVVRGVDHQQDLRALRPFIRDVRPALVAVDGGADALLEAGLTPDMIVGDMDSASEPTLLATVAAGELVVHSYPDGRAPGRHRLEDLSLPFKLVPAPGTSQDVAMLIAAEKGARLIVSVGSQFNLVEFLDRNRRGMSSTFLTRLRIGEILVDAKGVSRLYRPQPGLTPLLVVLLAGLVAMIAVVALTPALRDVVDLVWLKLQLLVGSRLRNTMFDYRYHALSLAAVLLALAVGVLIGVAIGDSNLVSSAKNGVVRDLSSEVNGANRQAAQLRAQLSGVEAVGNDLSEIAVHGLLNGRRIGLVFLGGSSDQIDGLVRDAVTQAGGNLVTVAAVHEPLDLGGLAHEASGTNYAALATQPGLVRHFGVRIARQLVGSDHKLLALVQGKLLSSFDGQLEGLDGLVVVRSEPEGMTPEEAKVTGEFEVALIEGRDLGGGAHGGGGAELHQSLADHLVQEPRHLQRRRPRPARGTCRAGVHAVGCSTAPTGKSRPPNRGSCRAWAAAPRCREAASARAARFAQCTRCLS